MRSVFALVVALLSAFLYYRAGPLSTFYFNHPDRLERVNRLEGFDVRFKDVIRNCEDIDLNDDEGWVLLSCDPGRDEWNTVMGTFVNPVAPPATGIYLYKYSDGSEAKLEQVDLGLSREDRKDFHPLGLQYHEPSQTLFVANHAREHCKIELYKLDVATRTATRVRTIQSPELAAPNSFAVISENEFLVTNDHYFLARNNLMLARIESYAAIPGGSIQYVKLSEDGGMEIKTLARVAFANGLTFLNSTTVAVAGSTAAAVKLYTIKYDHHGTPELTWLSSISVPFIPDNLSVDGNGKLLIAGHPHAPSLEKVSKNNRFCQGQANATRPGCQLPRLSWIAEWGEQDGLKTLYVGSEFGTSTTAVRDVKRGVGFAPGLYEKGLLTWRA